MLKRVKTIQVTNEIEQEELESQRARPRGEAEGAEPESARQPAEDLPAAHDAPPEVPGDPRRDEPVTDFSAGERSDAELENELCALLFASPEPLSSGRLAALLGLANPARLDGPGGALASLAARLEQARLPIELRPIAGGWQLFTSSAFAPCVARLSKSRKDEKISPAALETLAVIAYKQPVTKAEIEAIRGVQAGPLLRSLVDRGLVKIDGRSDVPGHPLLYATTKKFLDAFGLADLQDLPRDGELLRD
jgi:segregation and condensation protein B